MISTSVAAICNKVRVNYCNCAMPCVHPVYTNKGMAQFR